MMTGVRMVHVPYRGGRARADRSHRWTGAGDLLLRHVDRRIHQGEKVRALAVTSTARSEVLPDVPTVADFVPG